MKTKLKNLVIITFLMLGISSAFAQDKYGSDPATCQTNLSLFHESVKSKNYADAMKPWRYCYDNCPTASLYIYTDGVKIGKSLIANGDASGIALVNELYAKRIENFPTKNVGRAYNDWAKFLIANGGDNVDIDAKLKKAFDANPGSMTAKNIYRHFQNVTDMYKDTDIQKIFDTYDDVLDAVNTKIEKYTKTGKKLGGLPQIEGGLNSIVKELMTCERFIPLFKKDYDANNTDVTWLKRAARKLNKKGCTSDPLYGSILEKWVALDPSPAVLSYYAKHLENTGQTALAAQYKQKAYDAVTDPEVLAARGRREAANASNAVSRVLNEAIALKKKGSYSKARAKAMEAVSMDSSFGKAYLFIGTMYAESADSVGKNELDKRMVYVAAAAKMRKAMQVDPSLTSKAKKYISAYRGYYPDTKFKFKKGVKTGASHRVGGWIGETVRIP